MMDLEALEFMAAKAKQELDDEEAFPIDACDLQKASDTYIIALENLVEFYKEEKPKHPKLQPIKYINNEYDWIEPLNELIKRENERNGYHDKG